MPNQSPGRHSRSQNQPGSAATSHLRHNVSSASRRATSLNAGSSHRRSSGKRPQSGPQRASNRLIVLIVGLFAALIIGGIATAFIFSHKEETTQVTPGQTVTITIPDGAGGKQIAQMLLEKGVISDGSAFLQELSKQNAETKLKSGTYDFVTGANLKELVKLLISGPNSSASKLTVPEGLTVQKTAELVEKNLQIPASDFIAQAKASNYVKDFPFLSDAQNDSLEGFLYPKTYDFGTSKPTADTVIRAMLQQYAQEVASLDFAGAKAKLQERYGISFSQYQILTMASIIEREALNDDDRYKVASVFYNRLKADMALQSDATMGYVTGGDVTPEDLKKESPYNTYLNKGLTPTPVCAPSLASIKAAMEPADTKAMYFWIKEEGDYKVHAFSETYEQHQAVIADYNAHRSN